MRGGGAVPAFTLVELIVSIAIIAVLMSLVLPMATRTLAASRSFKCEMSLRSVGYDFRVFADDSMHGDRGDDNGQSGRFRMDNFQDSQYGVDEFWAYGDEVAHTTPDKDRNDPMRCAEVPGPLVLTRYSPCIDGGVTPWRNVSYAFNMRLRIAETARGPREVRLTGSLLSDPDVPLLFDVDAGGAAAHEEAPFYSAPALDSPMVFAGDRSWFPALRHNGVMNAAFMDGSVRQSSRPLAEPSWRWEFTPGAH